MTGVSLEELTDTAHLDWHDLACDMDDDCDNPAAWWAVCMSCQRHVPACDPCRRKWSAFVQKLAPVVRVECNVCHAQVDPARPGDAVSFVPIGA